MTLPRLITCALFVTACVPGTKSLGMGETGDEPTAGDDGANDTAADDGATSIGDSPTSVTNDTSCGPTTCEPCGPGCTDGAECSEGEWSCTCVCPDDDSGTGTGDSGSEGDSGETGPTAECNIVDVACEHADLSKTPPIDCGDVTFADDDAAWIQAHECARVAAMNTEPFKVIFDLQGIDSFPRRAFVGQAGVAYQLYEFDQDIGGLAPDPSPVTYRFCDAIVPILDCIPGVGEICLTCSGQTDTDVLCEGRSG
jgi:hypothetical protein